MAEREREGIHVKVNSSSTMDEYTSQKIKDLLGTRVLKKIGFTAGGCINEGEGYETDNGLVFIKRNNSSHAEQMFNSEVSSLRELEKTQTIRVPHPIGVVQGSERTFYCVLEFVEIQSLRKFASAMGERLADLHLHNENVAKNDPNLEYVDKFGFPQTTCVGLLPVDNTWSSDWPTFYTNRLEEQVTRLQSKTKEREAEQLWQELKPLMPKFFENLEIKPSLLHGDLWGGNVGETTTEPIIFDPGSVYGHHEFDLAMTTMFGRLSQKFYDAYHSKIPKALGFETREKLYHLFHALNHWNHFGSSYKSRSISLMKTLIRTKFPLK